MSGNVLMKEDRNNLEFRKLNIIEKYFEVTSAG